MGRARNISLSPRYDKLIEERGKATGDKFSRTIERLWDEAENNLAQARHSVNGKLNAARLHAVLARQALAREPAGVTQALSDLDVVINSIDEAAVTMAKPGGATGVKAVVVASS